MAKARRRRRFDEATKRKAVAAIGREGTLSQVAARLGIDPSLLVRWRHSVNAERPTMMRRARYRRVDGLLAARIDRLIAELTSLREEVKALEATKASIEEVMRRADL